MEKERICLKCGKMFHSMGRGNRICQKCKGLTSNSMAPSVPAGARKGLRERVRECGDDESWHVTPLLPRRKAK